MHLQHIKLPQTHEGTYFQCGDVLSTQVSTTIKQVIKTLYTLLHIYDSMYVGEGYDLELGDPYELCFMLFIALFENK